MSICLLNYPNESDTHTSLVDEDLSNFLRKSNELNNTNSLLSCFQQQQQQQQQQHIQIAQVEDHSKNGEKARPMTLSESCTLSCYDVVVDRKDDRNYIKKDLSEDDSEEYSSESDNNDLDILNNGNHFFKDNMTANQLLLKDSADESSDISMGHIPNLSSSNESGNQDSPSDTPEDFMTGSMKRNEKSLKTNEERSSVSFDLVKKRHRKRGRQQQQQVEMSSTCYPGNRPFFCLPEIVVQPVAAKCDRENEYDSNDTRPKDVFIRKRGRPPKNRSSHSPKNSSASNEESSGKTKFHSVPMKSSSNNAFLRVPTITNNRSRSPSPTQISPVSSPSIMFSTSEGLSVISVRSVPCFYEGCSYNYKRSNSSIVEISDRSMSLPAKFDGYMFRACKKHNDHWKALEPDKRDICELCRGLNCNFDSSYAKVVSDSRGVEFTLCTTCIDRQAWMLGLPMTPTSKPPPIQSLEIPHEAKFMTRFASSPKRSINDMNEVDLVQSRTTTLDSRHNDTTTIRTSSNDLKDNIELKEQVNVASENIRTNLKERVPKNNTKENQASLDQEEDVCNHAEGSDISDQEENLMNKKNDSFVYTLYASQRPIVGWEEFAKGVTYIKTLISDGIIIHCDRHWDSLKGKTLRVLDEAPFFRLSIRSFPDDKLSNGSNTIESLFADSDIPPCTVIGEYAGKVLESRRNRHRLDRSYRCFPLNDELDLDANLFGNEMRFLRDCSQWETNRQSPPENVRFEWIDGRLLVISLRFISSNEELLANYADFSLSSSNSSPIPRLPPVAKDTKIENAKGIVRECCGSRSEYYLQMFHLIDSFNKESLCDEEYRNSAFNWFIEEGYLILIQKGKLTIPIYKRFPVKKGLANTTKNVRSAGSSICKDPEDWGYVAQYVHLDMVRAREDCWVTFKPSKLWNADAFRYALSEWWSSHDRTTTATLNSETIIGPTPVHSNVPYHGPPSNRDGSVNLLVASGVSAKPCNPSVVSNKFNDAHKTFELELGLDFLSPIVTSDPIALLSPYEQQRLLSKLQQKPSVVSSSPKTKRTSELSVPEIRRAELCFEETGSMIGQGLHGYVIKALWNGVPVAVRSAKTKSLEERDEFFDQCISSFILHPNIVAAYGICGLQSNEQENLALVMEYMSLGNLKHWLSTFPIDVQGLYIPRIALDVARAMEFLHSKGILHNSLKSRNIFMKGEILNNGLICGIEVKVGDVGINKSQSALSFIPTSEDSRFLAPEILSYKRYTASSDVYSFGMVLCHLFSEASSEPKDPSEVLLNSKFLKAWNGHWKVLISRCVHSNPNMRPSFLEIFQLLNVLHSESAIELF